MNIIEASRLGDLDAVKKEIANGADVNAKNNSGWTPLHYAIFYGELEIVKELITAEANINVMDNGGRTALDYATQYSSEEMIEYSKQNGAVVMNSMERKIWLRERKTYLGGTDIGAIIGAVR